MTISCELSNPKLKFECQYWPCYCRQVNNHGLEVYGGFIGCWVWL
jgi:hypothetical protein